MAVTGKGALLRSVLIVILTAAAQASEDHAPSERPAMEQYAASIVGKWDIRTYGHEFKPDGRVNLFDIHSGDPLEAGTWSIQGDKLTMQWTSRGEQTARVRFLSMDRWEWHSTKNRVWEAIRLGQPPAR